MTNISDIEFDYSDSLVLESDINRLFMLVFPSVEIVALNPNGHSLPRNPSSDENQAVVTPISVCLNDEKYSEKLRVSCDWAPAQGLDGEADVQIALDPALFVEPNKRLPWNESTPQKGPGESKVNFYSSRLAGHSAAPVYGRFTFDVPFRVVQSLCCDFEVPRGENHPAESTSPAAGAIALPTKREPWDRTIYARVLVRESVNGVRIVLPSDLDALAKGLLLAHFTFHGYRGDVIRVNLSGLRAKEYGEVQELTQGWVVREGNIVISRNGSFAEIGELYVAPAITTPAESSRIAASGPTPVVVTFSANVRGTKRRYSFVVNVEAGYSAFRLDGSVGTQGVNRALDVTRVQQRLKYFNYPGRKATITAQNPVIVVDGRSNQVLIEAIRLFQASVQAGGRGNPASMTGRIEAIGHDLAWLNALNAPWWLQVENNLRGGSINQEIWATSWTLDIITLAQRNGVVMAAKIQSLSEYPDMAPSGGSEHGEHKAGLSVDWGVGGLRLGNNRELDSHLTPDEMYTMLTTDERQVVDALRGFQAAAGAQFGAPLFGGTGDQPSFPRIRQVARAYGITAMPHTNHHNHIHFRILPPARRDPREPSQDS